jgi:hypothetical protein
MMITMNISYWVLFVLSLFILVAAEGGGGGPSFNMDGEPKFCKPYKCSKGKTPVNKWPLSFKSSGCASLGGGGMSMTVPGGSDKNGPQEGCCDHRTACLQICGNTKMNCDEEFKQCTNDVCSKATDEKKCTESTSIFSIMINFENCSTYDQQQYSHCTCVATDDVPDAQKEILRKFYKKFSPDSIDKVDGLAEKVDTPRKMANLLGKLVKKFYPKTIQKIKDPQQERMERMMKDGDYAKKKTEEKEVEEDEHREEDEEEEDVQEL